MKAFAKSHHNGKYADALRDPECSMGYKAGVPPNQLVGQQGAEWELCDEDGLS